MSKETVYAYLVVVFALIMLGLAGHEDYKAQLDQDRDASAREIMLAEAAR